MTRSHKIGWLVLVLAVLFVLWRLPRMHGQGFGSFSHDQPFLAADRTSAVASPPMQNLFAWWHWEDVNTSATNWIARFGGYTWQTTNGAAATNDGTGVLFSGATYATNETVDMFKSGYATYVVCAPVGTNNGRSLITAWGNTTFQYGLKIKYTSPLNYNLYVEQGLSDEDVILSRFPIDARADFSYSIAGNSSTAEGWLNANIDTTAGAVYELTHDVLVLGNNRWATNSFQGYVYDILVYTNIYQWSTSSVPAVSNIYAWSTNLYYNKPLLASPTNQSEKPIAWWVAGDVATNASVITVPDRTGNGWALTNSDVAAMWPSISNSVLNGYSALSFNNSTSYLRNVAISNPQPLEVFFVGRHVPGMPIPTYDLIFDSIYSTNRCACYWLLTDKKLYYFAGTDVGGLHDWTNNWTIGNARFNDTNSSMLLGNARAVVTTSPNLNNMAGFTLGNAYTLTLGGNVQIVECMLYNTNITSAARYKLYTYLRSKYGL